MNNKYYVILILTLLLSCNNTLTINDYVGEFVNVSTTKNEKFKLSLNTDLSSEVNNVLLYETSNGLLWKFLFDETTSSIYFDYNSKRKELILINEHLLYSIKEKKVTAYRVGFKSLYDEYKENEINKLLSNTDSKKK